jgi:hypothetical protein
VAARGRRGRELVEGARAIHRRLYARYVEGCGFRYTIQLWNAAVRIAKTVGAADADAYIDWDALDCESPDAFFDSLWAQVYRLARVGDVDLATAVGAIAEEVRRAMEEWSRGNKSAEAIRAVNDGIDELLALGERGLARSLAADARRLKIPLRVRVPEPREVRRSRAARRRALAHARALAAAAGEAVREGREAEAWELILELERARRELVTLETAVEEMALWAMHVCLAQRVAEMARALPPELRERVRVDSNPTTPAVDIVFKGTREEFERVLRAVSPAIAALGLEVPVLRGERAFTVALAVSRSVLWEPLKGAVNYLLTRALESGVPLKEVHAWLSRHEVACTLALSPSRETVERLLVLYPLLPREALTPPQREAVETAGGPGPAAVARYEEIVAALREAIREPLREFAEVLGRLARMSEREYREEVRRYLTERARAELEIGGDMQRCIFYAYSACFTPESVRCTVECAAEVLWAMHYSKWITDEEYSRVARLRHEGKVEEFIEEVCSLIERFRRDWEATVEWERQSGRGGRGARVPPPWCGKRRERKTGTG